MKIYKLIVLCMASLLTVACDKSLDEDANLNVSVVTNDNVSYDGKIITVKKGTPVEFLLSGDPNFLTFFSGETGKKYQYRERETIDPSQIQSSTLNFNLWFLYGSPALVTQHVYISDEFPGLDKSNFEADSVLVEQFQKDGKWKDMIAKEDFPTTAYGSVSSYVPTLFSINMTEFLGKRIAIAICYEGIGNTNRQSALCFGQMKIDNVMKSGQATEYGADSFGFTPINMKSKSLLTDQIGLASNRQYGTVAKNDEKTMAGLWNTTSIASGSFNINNSATGATYKYSWLVSDLITINSCTPDQGTQIKNISQRLDSYTYTYQQVGIYNATFLANNANMDYSSTATSHLVINVIE